MPPLPTNYLNDTPSQDQHPAAHNQTNVAVNQNTTDVATNAAAIAANTTAMARLPKGQLNLTPHAGGTVLQGTPLPIATPSLTMTGRYIRVAFRANARAAGGACLMEVAVAAPGATNVVIVRNNIGSGGAGSISENIYNGAVTFAATGNGAVTVTITNTTATNSIIVTSVAVAVDDVGAV